MVHFWLIRGDREQPPLVNAGLADDVAQASPPASAGGVSPPVPCFGGFPARVPGIETVPELAAGELGLPTAGLATCAASDRAHGWRGMVTRLQRWMAIMALYPGRCPGLSYYGLSGRLFAPSFWKKKALGLSLTEQLRGCATASVVHLADLLGHLEQRHLASV